VENFVDNCGLLRSSSGKTYSELADPGSNLWITVDNMWTDKVHLTRENIYLSLFHRPITVIYFLFSYHYWRNNEDSN
jgi:hypothetical protein